MTTPSLRSLFAALIAGGLSSLPFAADAAPMRIAFGDLPGIESVQTLAAIERAKERGVEIELTILNDEDLATQAIVAGQADVGIGAPYTIIQKAGVPIRIFAQIATARFFPVVNTDFYKSWKDLDGQEIAVQGRGSGTEAVMMMMAKKHGITYSAVSYVPGSEVRRGAMMQGTIKASIVDAANRRILEEEGKGKFIVLPVEGLKATDEALFATNDYIAANAEAVDTLVEEILKTAREIAENPKVAVELRAKYKLLPELGAEADGDLEAYYKETTEAGALALNGGGADAVKDDFDFYTLSEAIEGDPASLKAEDFWNMASLERVTAKIGTK